MKRSYLLAYLTLLLGALVLLMLYPSQVAYTQNPPTTPTPDIVATLDHQAQQINRLSNDLENARLDVRQEMLSWLGGVLVLGAILGGVIGGLGVRDHLKRRFEEHIANAIYAVDPSNISIHIPDQHFATEERLLRKVGFQRISYYPYPRIPDNALKGCLIYPAKDDAELQRLLEVIQEKAPDPDYCAVLAYNGRYDNQLIDEFIKRVRFATPNMATTIPSHIYGVARGLKH